MLISFIMAWYSSLVFFTTWRFTRSLTAMICTAHLHAVDVHWTFGDVWEQTGWMPQWVVEQDLR